MLFGWGGADGTGLPDGQGLIEEVVFKRRAERGESVNATNTESKNMKSSTNSTSKVLKQDRAGQVQKWQGGQALEQPGQRKSSRRRVREVTGGQITWGTLSL